MVHIEFHVLFNRGFSNLNRDKNNCIKQGYFAGVNRIRQSPQNARRPVRELVNKSLEESGQENLTGTRSVEFPNEVYQYLLAKGKDKDDAKKVAENLFSAIVKLGDPDKKNPEAFLKLSTMLFLGKLEIACLKKVALERFDDLVNGLPDAGSFAKDVTKKILSCKSAIDVALFGRFVPSVEEMKVIGAVEVAHPFSVNAANKIDDFFVAVDDISKGNPMIGGEFDGNTYAASLMYQYATINLTTLAQNLNDDSLVETAVSLFAKAFVSATPNAKRTSSAEHSRPVYVRAIVCNEPLSLYTAFEKPVVPTATQTPSAIAIQALNKYSAECRKTFDFPAPLFDGYIASGVEFNDANAPAVHAGSVSELIAKVVKTIRN